MAVGLASRTSSQAVRNDDDVCVAGPLARHSCAGRELLFECSMYRRYIQMRTGIALLTEKEFSVSGSYCEGSSTTD